MRLSDVIRGIIHATIQEAAHNMDKDWRKRMRAMIRSEISKDQLSDEELDSILDEAEFERKLVALEPPNRVFAVSNTGEHGEK